ncbi:MAG TPA: cobyrinate a,c-diamide synthase [Gaiellales bacterium]|jgi:cobyrinic acid a,c-diamide synthase|nr:cobyrinate a,c-diamide synthase [Gaiellales bacterium]
MRPDSSQLSAIVVAGTHSGVGKTSITLGLIGALRRRDLTVQPFKVGPDFIDPLHHQQASGRPPRNLDGWMLTPDTNRERFARHTTDVDVAVIEGVMGLFDGSEGGSERGSTAEMAKLLQLPVVLVVDASAMARSAAAVVHGFTSFDPDLRVAAVILNNVGGDAHAGMIRDAVGGAVPILGAIPRARDLVVPERHLGLHLPHEARRDHVDQLAGLIEQHIDLEKLIELGLTERRPFRPVPTSAPHLARIGVARDEAFCFYYADNLELLRRAGAELVEFSPIRDQLPADLDGLYLGGGYPEIHAATLAENVAARDAIRELAARGAPIYAECGGLMYLAEVLELDGERYPLCGVLPFGTRMPGPLKLAYVEVTTTGGIFGPGHRARGHIFHWSEIIGEPHVDRAYRLRTSRGDETDEGYDLGNVLASYAHLHFASEPELATALLRRCQSFRL